jgi:hypothetical protein
MGDLFPEDGDPNDPWNRASVIFGSRKPRPAKIGPEDLLAPSGLGNVRMTSMCAVMAFCMTVLYFWPVLFFVNFWIPLRRHAYGGLFLAALVGFFLFLYVAGTRETRRDRELAAKL